MFEVKGHFKIESIDDNGNVIDTFEDSNLVMDNARIAMAMLMSGDGNKINRFKIGTHGYYSNAPREPNEVGGYTSARTDLFSKGNTDQYTYDAKFDITNGIGGRGRGKLYKGNLEVSNSDNPNYTPSMTISQLGQEVTYTIVIPKQCGNHTNENLYYNEAALFADDLIFSMKCFEEQLKNTGNALVITWSIIF